MVILVFHNSVVGDEIETKMYKNRTR